MIDRYIYSELYKCCAWSPKFDNDIRKILESHKDIDVLYREGQLLRFAIISNDLDLLNMLIGYYTEGTLKPKQGTPAYDSAKYKLCLILNEANKEIFDISSEIQGAINPYIKIFNDEDSTSLSEENQSDMNNSDFEDDNSSASQDHDQPVISNSDFVLVPLTENNLNEFNHLFETDCALEEVNSLLGLMRKIKVM
jgi:hypothetical protein